MTSTSIFPDNNESLMTAQQAMSDYMTGKFAATSPYLALATGFAQDIINDPQLKNIQGVGNPPDRFGQRRGVQIRSPRPIMQGALSSDNRWVDPEAPRGYTERFEQAFARRFSDGSHITSDDMIFLFKQFEGAGSPYNYGAWNEGMRVSIQAVLGATVDAMITSIQQYCQDIMARKANVVVDLTSSADFYTNGGVLSAIKTGIATLISLNGGLSTNSDLPRYSTILPPDVCMTLPVMAASYTQATRSESPYGPAKFLRPIYDFGGTTIYQDSIVPIHIAGTASAATMTLGSDAVENTSTLTLSSGTTDYTVVPGDVIKITDKKANVRTRGGTAAQIARTGKSIADLYFTVVAGGTASGGNLQVEVSPTISSEMMDLNDLTSGTALTVLGNHRKGFIVDRNYLKSRFFMPTKLFDSESMTLTYNFDQYNPGDYGSMRLFLGSYRNVENLGNTVTAYTTLLFHAFENCHCTLILPVDPPTPKDYIKTVRTVT